MTTNLPSEITVRAAQVGDRLDLKGLERDDAISKNPLAWRTPGGGLAVLFRFGAKVYAGTTAEDEAAVDVLIASRVVAPLPVPETETVRIQVRPDEREDGVSPDGLVRLRSADDVRLLLIAEAVATSNSLALGERRIAGAFDRIEPVAAALRAGRLPKASRADMLREIGEALLIQQRLAGRLDHDEKPDVLWDHPELERLWARLVEEYDLAQRARAISRKLDVIQEMAETLGDLLATRTSHRLEWYIIALIAFEIVLGLGDRLLR